MRTCRSSARIHDDWHCGNIDPSNLPELMAATFASVPVAKADIATSNTLISRSFRTHLSFRVVANKNRSHVHDVFWLGL